MRKPDWTPSIVPKDDDQNVYMVLDDFGRNGQAYRETDVERAGFEAVIIDMLESQYKNPVRVIGFNTAEGWSQDVSADVSQECVTVATSSFATCRSTLSSSSSATKAAITTFSCRCQCPWFNDGVSAQEAGGDRRPRGNFR